MSIVCPGRSTVKPWRVEYGPRSRGVFSKCGADPAAAGVLTWHLGDRGGDRAGLLRPRVPDPHTVRSG